MPDTPQPLTISEALTHSCTRYELRRRLLEVGHQQLGWPEPGDVDDKLYDGAESLAEAALKFAVTALPEKLMVGEIIAAIGKLDSLTDIQAVAEAVRDRVAGVSAALTEATRQ